MKPYVIGAAVLSVLTISFFMSSLFGSPAPIDLPASVYDFKMNALDGRVIDFSAYKGKYILIVNTASKCGFTPQYADLEKMAHLYGNKVAVLGFPANNFLWQEPGSNAEIGEFCSKNYGVTFQMFEKISVKGKTQAPLYQWLKKKSGGETPSWNFCKYLLDQDGNFVAYYGSKVNPMDPQITGKFTAKN